MSDKKRLSVTIPEELISKVDKYAKEMGVTKSVYLALLIRKDIEKKEKKYIKKAPSAKGALYEKHIYAYMIVG